MSHVWETQYRLLCERLEEMLHRNMDDLTDDEIARVVCGAYVLLAQHKVDKRGRCRHCYRSGSWWLPRRRKGCTVYQVLAVAMGQPFTVVRGWLEDH